MTPEESFAQFYRGTKDRTLRAVVACGTDPPAAEEAVAEAFARAWASWTTVARHPAPAAWVARVALNHHVSRWRRTRREVAVGDLPETGPAPEAPERDEELRRLVAALPERQRQVVALRHLLDLDTAATAEALGIAPGTVTAHLHRGLATLRAALSAEPTPSPAPTRTETHR